MSPWKKGEKKNVTEDGKWRSGSDTSGGKVARRMANLVYVDSGIQESVSVNFCCRCTLVKVASRSATRPNNIGVYRARKTMPLCSQFVASWQRSPWNDHDGVPGWASNQRKTRYTIYHEKYLPRWFNERTADRRSKESSPPFRSFRLSNLCRKKIQARTFSPWDVSGNGMKREWFSLSSHLPVRVWRSVFRVGINSLALVAQFYYFRLAAASFTRITGGIQVIPRDFCLFVFFSTSPGCFCVYRIGLFLG